MASPEALVIMKLTLGRDKDDADAFLLLTSGRVNRKFYLRAIKSLNQYDLERYADMIP